MVDCFKNFLETHDNCPRLICLECKIHEYKIHYECEDSLSQFVIFLNYVDY
jgi:hypothetical protein